MSIIDSIKKLTTKEYNSTKVSNPVISGPQEYAIISWFLQKSWLDGSRQHFEAFQQEKKVTFVSFRFLRYNEWVQMDLIIKLLWDGRRLQISQCFPKLSDKSTIHNAPFVRAGVGATYKDFGEYLHSAKGSNDIEFYDRQKLVEIGVDPSAFEDWVSTTKGVSTAFLASA